MEQKKKSIVKEIIGWMIGLTVLFAVSWLTVHYVAEKTQVKGESMWPTLSEGDSLLVDKISYHFREPKRFDLIVFPFQYQEDTWYIKRVIALPGETVWIKDGEIYINGKRLEESYGREKIQSAGLASSPVTLAQDEYFVLGDNRNQSADSREPGIGNIRKDRIIGCVRMRIWPFTKISFIS